ncbi:MAG TPA: hypothetical protein VHY79_17440 [Rhizomicrobium sp.]|nr:hypothetical protein [Rhizomicrobium sp.]
MSGATADTTYTVGYVLDQVNLLSARRTFATDRRNYLKSVESDLTVSLGQVDKARNKAGQARIRLVTDLERFALAAGELQDIQILTKRADSPDDYLNSLDTARHVYLTVKTSLAASNKPLQTLSDDLNNFEQASEDYSEANSHAQQEQTIVTRAEDSYEKAHKSGDHPSSPPFDKDSFVQLSDDLARYHDLLGGIPFDFVAWPNIILTLVLTILMGILGSLIALTRELVFECAEHPLGQYMFRIGLGASVALAVFLFAGAGALTLAQTSAGAHGGVELSPYLVSFLGIISGYLSRRVTLWIRETGGKVFPVREEADRWAIDLKQALAAGGGDVDSLSQAIAVPVDTINQWIDRKAAIPNSAQALIAAFLRRPAYQLFSDISPPP